MLNKLIAVIFVITAVTGATYLLVCQKKPDVKDKNEKVAHPVKIEKRASRRNDRAKRAEHIRTQDEAKSAKPPRLMESIDPDEDLDSEMRNVIAELQDALDANKKDSVIKIVQQLQHRMAIFGGKASAAGADGKLPKSIKLMALDALGWIGGKGVAEVAGFLADENPEVVQSAIEKYEMAMSDISLSDRERAVLLVQASKIIDDADAMNMMMFELCNMRHSVAVNCIKQVMAQGSEASKSVLPENVEFYTGEGSLNTPEKLDEWLIHNPDDEFDEDFYGGFVIAN